MGAIMSDENKPRLVVKVIGISTLISVAPLIALGMQLHDKYVGWHDDRYTLRDETISLAQAGDIRDTLKNTTIQATANSSKLDRLLLDAARQNMWASEDRYLRMKNNPSSSDLDIRDAEKRFDLAREYYECIRDSKPDCQKLQGG